MIFRGVRVSRTTLVGDPAFGLMRLPAPRLPSRNTVTSLGASVSQQVRVGKGGFLSRVGGFLGALGGAVPGPIGTAITIGKTLGGTRTAARLGGGVLGAFGGAAELGARAGMGFAGRMTKRGGFTMRRRPRMRATNTRPLLRALRRVRAFERIARRVIHVTPHFRRRPHVRGAIRRRR